METSQIKFRATTEWMANKYNELNQRLFGGSLGTCDFSIFTTGRGSQGSVLGWFKLKGYNLKIESRTNRIYSLSNMNYDKIYIDRKNFCEICKPAIELNGHYIGTELAFSATLLHEMCHYYTYMFGYAPKQGHGPEFRQIAQIVSSNSNGEFSIQRVASAEEISNYELDADVKAKKEARINNKKSKLIAVFVFKKDGSVDLSLSTNRSLIDKIIYYNTSLTPIVAGRSRDKVEKIISSSDTKLIELLYNYGFRKSMRTYRYWPIDIRKFGGFDFIENGGYTYKVEYSSENILDNDKNNNDLRQKPKKQIFFIRTTNGVVEIPFNGSKEELKQKLSGRFPKMSDETLDRIINNKANYKVMENKRNFNIGMIVENVINEFLANKKNEDSIEITPDMNLGIASPFEIDNQIKN